MVRFFLKKTFWDGWDNLFALILGNAGYVALAAAAYGLISLARGPVPDFLVFAAACALAGAHACALAAAFTAVADGGSGLAREYRRGLASTWSTGAALGVLVALSLGALALAVPYYAAVGGLPGAAAIGFILWMLAVLWLALQWTPAVAALTGARRLKAVRKSFTALLANPGLSLVLAAHRLVTLAISLPLAMFVPGPAGMELASVEALRLDLRRYAWLVGRGEHAAAGPVPWASLLADDAERLGARSLREALFFGKRVGSRR